LPVSPAFLRVHIPSANVFSRVILAHSSAHLLETHLLGPFAEALPAEHDVVSAYEPLFAPAHLAFVRTATVDLLAFSSH
jgi:hypothetical protein